MDLSKRGALNRASFGLITALLCPVMVLIGACGVAPAPSAEETPATTQAGQSPAASGAPPTSEEPENPPAPPRRPQAPGSPLRIPLPADSLMGRLLSDAERQVKGLISEACGGSHCIDLEIEPRGSLDPAGRSGCETRVVSVPGSRSEEVDGGWSIPVLYVPSGGTITLVVQLSCDETVVTESPGSPSPVETPVTPSVDEGQETEPGGDPSMSSVPPTP